MLFKRQFLSDFVNWDDIGHIYLVTTCFCREILMTGNIKKQGMRGTGEVALVAGGGEQESREAGSDVQPVGVVQPSRAHSGAAPWILSKGSLGVNEE